MTEIKKVVEKQEEKRTIDSPSRRKAVKTLAAGAGALAAYHTLPVNWSTPIIEQVFLPAHAQTSGECASEYTVSCSIVDNGIETVPGTGGAGTGYNWLYDVTGSVSPPVAGLEVYITVTLFYDNEYQGQTYQFENPVVLPFSELTQQVGALLTDENGEFSLSAFLVSIGAFEGEPLGTELSVWLSGLDAEVSVECGANTCTSSATPPPRPS